MLDEVTLNVNSNVNCVNRHLSSGTFADAFHKFGVEWNETMIRYEFKGVSCKVLRL